MIDASNMSDSDLEMAYITVEEYTSHRRDLAWRASLAAEAIADAEAAIATLQRCEESFPGSGKTWSAAEAGQAVEDLRRIDMSAGVPGAYYDYRTALESFRQTTTRITRRDPS